MPLAEQNETPAAPACNLHAADARLAASILARDRKATAALVELHSDTVYAFVWKRLAPRTEMIDDIVQEVFIAAWRSLSGYSAASSLRSWLLGIAFNKVQDHYRAVLRNPLLELEAAADSTLIAPALDLDGELDAGRRTERAVRILEELPVEYAAVLRWRYWDDCSTRQIANASGRTEKAVERLLARARQRFHNRWIA